MVRNLESTLLNINFNENSYSPLTLAFIGDSVFELLVREHLLSKGNRDIKTLNNEKVKIVCCQKQAELIKGIVDILTEEELAVFKRGRNAHSSSVPKNATISDYHAATGLEALFGYLYLKGNILRIRELFSSFL